MMEIAVSFDVPSPRPRRANSDAGESLISAVSDEWSGACLSEGCLSETGRRGRGVLVEVAIDGGSGDGKVGCDLGDGVVAPASSSIWP